MASEGSNPYTLGTPGIEKSSISLFSSRPVLFEMSLDPNPVLIVMVMDTAFSSASIMDRWLVPLSAGT